MEDRVRRKIIVYIATSASRHRAHHCESHIQKTRSRRPTRGRLERRRSRASCCRSARFSRTKSVRAFSAARRVLSRASTRGIATQARLTGDPRPACDRYFGQRQGTEYLAKVEPILAALEEANQAALGTELRGVLRLAVPTSICRPGDHSPAAAIPGSLPEART